MWHGVPFACQRRPIIGVLRMCWLLPGSFDCFCCPHTSVHSPIGCVIVTPPPQLYFISDEADGHPSSLSTLPAPPPCIIHVRPNSPHANASTYQHVFETAAEIYPHKSLVCVSCLGFLCPVFRCAYVAELSCERLRTLANPKQPPPQPSIPRSSLPFPPISLPLPLPPISTHDFPLLSMAMELCVCPSVVHPSTRALSDGGQGSVQVAPTYAKPWGFVCVVLPSCAELRIPVSQTSVRTGHPCAPRVARSDGLVSSGPRQNAALSPGLQG